MIEHSEKGDSVVSVTDVSWRAYIEGPSCIRRLGGEIGTLVPLSDPSWIWNVWVVSGASLSAAIGNILNPLSVDESPGGITTHPQLS